MEYILEIRITSLLCKLKRIAEPFHIKKFPSLRRFGGGDPNSFQHSNLINFDFWCCLYNCFGLVTMVASGHNTCGPLLPVTIPDLMGRRCTTLTQLSIKPEFNCQYCQKSKPIACLGRMDSIPLADFSKW